jgi:hypothetical protein
MLILHIVVRGRCWISGRDDTRHWADEGEGIVLPYGEQHRMGGVLHAETVPIFSLLDPPPWIGSERLAIDGPRHLTVRGTRWRD